MVKIIIIGSGNVAQHLMNAFVKSDSVELVQVFSRNKQAQILLPNSIKITNDFNTLAEADLYIIAVSDDAIASVYSQLPFQNRFVVHTSGSFDLNLADSKNRKGVFYSLQTFSKNKLVDFKTIPICLEAQNEKDYCLLEQVAKSISDSFFAINSQQRKALHVAAVFVNNFANHLFQIGNDICIENQVPFEILKPLITETAVKIMTLSPHEAQTGPAKRIDLTTITAHETFLSNENQLSIYKILTQSIQNHGKKL